MAKLSARGRTEVYRVSKTIGTTIYKRALMSDRVILRNASFLQHDGKTRRTVGWTVLGRLKQEISPETWLANKQDQGWTKITR